MQRKQPADDRPGRVSPTAPASKSLSVAVWKALEGTPGFNDAMKRGVGQIAEGKVHPLRETAKRQSKQR